MERLQKVIANSGYTSRRNAEKLMSAGKVVVDGEVITELGYKVSGREEIMVEGNMLSKEGKEYYLLYKPKGVISSSKDEKNRKTVIDLVGSSARLYPVGRLDYDTTGIILITNDGDLTNGLLHPSVDIEKVYSVKLDGIIDGASINKLKNGIVIDGKMTSHARVKLKSKNRKNNTSMLEVTIHEGFNHQIKKMFKSTGYDVINLKRTRFAGLDLSGLRKGEFRKLNPKEVKVLYSLIKKSN